MASKGKTEAFAYLRTSSATNVGADQDSEKRQRAGIAAYARRAGFEIVATFNDEAVRGTDLIEDRPGFSALLDRIEGNGVRIVLVEDASRLARSVLVQELAILALQARNVRVLAANGDDLTETDDEMKVAMRQIAGAFAQLEKARLVKKLRGARERKRKEAGKCEGRKTLAERDALQHGGATPMIDLARRLRRKRPKGGQMSLRAISAELASAGFVAASGKPFAPTAVGRILGEIRAK